MPKELSHITSDGTVRMVDVGEKKITQRTASASALVVMSAATLQLVNDGQLKKGDVFSVARIAGIQACKRTAELIPLCHPLPITSCSVTVKPVTKGVHITATVSCTGRTGVEMEALTATSVAALTVYDMVKAVERGVKIENIQLETKSGGKSGDYQRD